MEVWFIFEVRLLINWRKSECCLKFNKCSDRMRTAIITHYAVSNVNFFDWRSYLIATRDKIVIQMDLRDKVENSINEILWVYLAT